MKKLLIGLLALISASSYGATLIECDGIDNPNSGIVRIVTNENGDLSNKALVATFQDGTFYYHLSDVSINQDESKLIDHTDVNGARLLIKMSEELLTDGSNTIRPYYYKSRVYFKAPGVDPSINTDFMKCRMFKNF